MKLKTITHSILFASAIVFSSSSFAAVIDVDFNSYAAGTQISNQIDGVTFAVLGGPGPSGAAVINHGGLTNSTVGNYPTGSILELKFTGLANLVNFTFNNYGNPSTGRGATFYTAYDALGSVLETGNVGGGGSFSLASAGITDLRFNNNTNGSENWIFALNTLKANVSPVPEPETYALMGLGLVGLFAARRRKAVSA
ncbi:PEP-CTERM sorting domain-containing protein [Iodobacter sp. HSC-16F04]|uniref:PEP-CTERM sorting domain-containing protein n=1 Tax=Iodobacter violaceini TaxID=3044271 RepID=A0ABX0KXQ5_9NEIS|nr:PEP-CTERM sorting domain-containing protein [Iodobacter violacea]NHQ87433.1 PEP-CTERM sorting domain-containing protein [Iodobacter violacea]